MEAQVCFDSGLKLICVVGSGVSQLPLANTTQIVYRLQVRPVGWSAKHSNTMVSTPVTSSFCTVGWYQVLLEMEIGISIKLATVWKHKVLVDNCVDAGLDKTECINTSTMEHSGSRCHGTPNHP